MRRLESGMAPVRPASALVQPAVSHTAPAGKNARTVRTADGIELVAYVSGPQDASVTVVLVHGWNASASDWEPLLDELGPTFSKARVVCYDQRGHGQSPLGSAPISIRLLSEDLARVIEVTAPTGRVVLAGHSMGGMAILELAASHPELFGTKVSALLLASTTAGGLDPSRPGKPLLKRLRGTAVRAFAQWCTTTPDRAERLRGLLPGPNHRTHQTIVRRLACSPELSDEAVAERARRLHAVPLCVLSTFYLALMRHDAVASLPSLAGIPVSILVGDQDRLTPVHHSRQLAREINGATLEIKPDCGHSLPSKHPDVVLHYLHRLVTLTTDSPSRTKHQRVAPVAPAMA